MSEANILLIEDDETAYNVTQACINKIDGDIDYKVDWAPDFNEGLRQILDNKHDVYLVDYKLAGEDGIELVRMARDKGHKGPFVILTGSDDSAVYTKALNTGVYDYIVKSELSPSLIDRAMRYAVDRKRIEDELIAEKEFTSFIVSEVPYLIISVDKDGKIVSTNPFVAKITGYPPDYFIGQNWKSLIADEKQREDVVFKITDEDHIGFEAKLLDSKGEEHHILWNVLNKKIGGVRSPDVGFVLSGKDVTHQMENEAMERQRQKTEALGRLAGGVAHEINNLLQPVLFLADIIKNKATDEKTAQSADKITRNTISAAKIVDDILTFARKDRTDNKDMKVIETVQEALLFIEDLIPPGITIDDKRLDSLIDCDAFINKTDMMRIIKNTVLNAAHAMNNEGKVTVSAERVMIDSDARRLGVKPGHYMKISVADKGCGIPADVLERIYDPFFTTKEVGEGTGLGLSIVHNIMRSWKGAVDVETTVGKGTCFSYYVPVNGKFF